MSDTDDWTEPREVVPSPLEQLIVSAQQLIDAAAAKLLAPYSGVTEVARDEPHGQGPAYITGADLDVATIAARVHSVDVNHDGYRATATCSKCGYLTGSADIEFIRNRAAGHLVHEILKAARVEVQRG